MSSIAFIEQAAVAASDPPTFAELRARSITWIGFVFVAGPPILFLAVPLLVLALSLIWAFALLFALAAVFVVVMTAVGFAVALLALPYMLIRRARARRTARSHITGSGAHGAAVKSPRAVA
jgi:hypothetical protein